MKGIAEMSNEELLQYCYNLKKNGSSFRELANLFDQHNIDQEVRKNIIKSLDSLDRQQKAERDKQDRTDGKIEGVRNLLVGLGALVFGFILFNLSAKAGGIFIFNIVVWAFGGLLTLRGIVGLIKSD